MIILNKIKQSTLIMCLMMATFFAMTVFATPAFADTQEEVCKGAGGTLNGAGECVNNTSVSLFGSGSIFEAVVNVLLFVIGAISVIMIIVGGIRYVVSGGDANATKGAKDTILYAIVGLVVAVLAYALVNFVITAL